MKDEGVINKMSCAYRMETLFLSSVISQAKEKVIGFNSGSEVIDDIADSTYKKIKLLSLFSDESENENLLDYKKKFLIWEFFEIEPPRLLNKSSQDFAIAKYVQYFTQRQKEISELKESIENSTLLAKILCVYLARSNYPKMNAFEILPSELESLFNSERNNSIHLKGVKILDNIFKIQDFNL
jgi:hypothetical protein